LLAQDAASVPWYRQFWPWFIILLPASVVVAGAVMIVVAFNGADTLVNDNYYRDGLAINQTLDQDSLAQTLGLQAEVIFDQLSGEVIVLLSGRGERTDDLQLLLLHPVDALRDLTIKLLFTGSSMSTARYRADLDRRLTNRYYLRLTSVGKEASWRLNGELNFERSQRLVLVPNG
jgi:uncharacterized protein